VKLRRIICITGPICSGKTVLAGCLAQAHRTFNDLDVRILDDCECLDRGIRTRVHVALNWQRRSSKRMLIIAATDLHRARLGFLRGDQFRKRVQFIELEGL
jgi:hypothetical protein